MGIFGSRSPVIVASLVSVIAFAAAHGAAAIEMTPELKKIVDGARKEGALKIMTGATTMGAGDGAKAAAQWINKTFGLDIEWSWNPGPPMAQQGARIFTEHQAGQEASSDVYAATAVQVTPLMQKGLFRQVEWRKLLPGRITPDLVEGDGRALKMVTQVPGIMYNKRRMSAQRISTIKTMADLLKPEWKGKFFTTIYLAGFDVLASEEVWGAKKAADYARRWSQHIGGILNCGSPERIASGEFPALVIDCAGADDKLPRFKDVLSLHVIGDNAQKRYQYVTIPQNAAHPNAGILYTVFFSTKEGQDFLYRNRGSDLYDYPDSNTRAWVEPIEKQGIKFRDVTVDWYAQQKGIAKAHRRMVKIIRARKRN